MEKTLEDIKKELKMLKKLHKNAQKMQENAQKQLKKIAFLRKEYEKITPYDKQGLVDFENYVKNNLKNA